MNDYKPYNIDSFDIRDIVKNPDVCKVLEAGGRLKVDYPEFYPEENQWEPGYITVVDKDGNQVGDALVLFN